MRTGRSTPNGIEPTLATLFSHELGHALSPGGMPAGTSSPGLAIQRSHQAEGVALTSELTTARQLGLGSNGRFSYSDQGREDQPAGTLARLYDQQLPAGSGSPEGWTLSSPGARATLDYSISPVARTFGSMSGQWSPSVAPNLTYDQYNGAYAALNACGRDNDPQTIDWLNVQKDQVVLNDKPDGSCRISTPSALPRLDGKKASIEGEWSPAGDPITVKADIYATYPDGGSVQSSYDETGTLVSTITDVPDGQGGLNRTVVTTVQGKALQMNQHIDASQLATDSNGDGNPVDAGEARTTDVQVDGQAALMPNPIKGAIDANYQDANALIAARNTGQLGQLTTAADASQPSGWRSLQLPDRSNYTSETKWATAVSDQLRLYTNTLTSTQALIAALKSGNSRAIATSSFSLLASLNDNKTLGQINEVYGALSTVYHLYDAFKRGDTAGIIGGSAQLGLVLTNQYLSVLKDELTQSIVRRESAEKIADLTQEIQEVSELAINLGQMVNVINIFTAFNSHQYLDANMTTVSLIPGYSQMIYAAYQLEKVGDFIGEKLLGHTVNSILHAPLHLITEFVNDLFEGIFGGGHRPNPNGSAASASSGDGMHVTVNITANNDRGGTQAQAVLRDLVTALERAMAAGSKLGMVASRLPTLSYRSGEQDYRLTLTDADTDAVTVRQFDLRASAVNQDLWGVAA